MSIQLPPYLQQIDDTSWYLLVRVQPGAKKSEYCGEIDGRLRIRLNAQPIENKANKALIVFLAKTLKVKQSKVTLVSGETGRQKKIRIESLIAPDWSVLMC